MADLEDFENLSKDSGVTIITPSGASAKLNDLDLDTSEQASAEFVVTITWSEKKMGIYKVILYAENSADSVADWEVRVN